MNIISMISCISVYLLFFEARPDSLSESESLELEDPELLLSELKPVGVCRSTFSAIAATSGRDSYMGIQTHF